MCECIKKLENKLLELLHKEYPGDDWEIIENPEFENKSLTLNFENSTCVEIFKNPVLGKVRKGKLIRKFTKTILPLYCPYCGEKINYKNDKS
jgi:hypothetical protein